MIPRTRRRSSLSAIAATALVTALMGGSAGVSAQGGEPFLEVNLTDPCVYAGEITVGATVTFTLKRAGTTIAKDTFKASDVQVNRCLAKAPRPGDTLRIKQVKNGATLSNRVLAIPTVTVAIDTSTDTVTGHAELNGAPFVGADMLIELTMVIGGRALQGGQFSGVSDGDGNLVNSWAGAYDAQPGSFGMAMVITPKNDAVRAFTAQPSVAIRTGKPGVIGTAKPGATTTVTLKTGGGAVRARATGTARLLQGDPLFKGTFTKNGSNVRPATGETVTSSRLSGSWTVLANTLAVTPGFGTGSISVTCPDDVVAGAWVNGGSIWWDRYASGAITFSDQLISSGDVVEVACQDANGYGQWFRTVVP